jgi:PRTRC genetic system protein A
VNLVDYYISRPGQEPPPPSALYDYFLAGNGVFVEGHRAGLHAVLPLAWASVRGLQPVRPGAVLDYPQVPAPALAKMLELAKAATDAQGHIVEILFHLEWLPATRQWRLHTPRQEGGATHVSPLDTGPGTSYATSLIELHSHHSMGAFWSGTDDKDEQGFKIYAVLGNIFRRPTIRVRVGLYGYFLELPPQQIFALPPGVWGPQARCNKEDNG